MVNVQIYTKSYCPFCHRAKGLLDEYQVTYDETQLDEDPERFERLKEETGQKTVPQIFINGEFIGGCDELFELEESGELKTRLSS